MVAERTERDARRCPQRRSHAACKARATIAPCRQQVVVSGEHDELFAGGRSGSPILAITPMITTQVSTPSISEAEGGVNLSSLRPNIVQSIRAFRVPALLAAAQDAQQHFLYANVAEATTKQEVLENIARSFLFPKHFGKNFDALRDCMTDMIASAGAQPGFVIVLEQLPVTQRFDKEARETLLDVFRDAADFWYEHGVEFRVFYSFL